MSGGLMRKGRFGALGRGRHGGREGRRNIMDKYCFEQRCRRKNNGYLSHSKRLIQLRKSQKESENLKKLGTNFHADSSENAGCWTSENKWRIWHILSFVG